MATFYYENDALESWKREQRYRSGAAIIDIPMNSFHHGRKEETARQSPQGSGPKEGSSHDSIIGRECQLPDH
jgi:hypothetical protein